MDINKLKKDIEMQTRNGRKEVYVKIADLKELIDELEGNYGEQRMYLEVDYVEELIRDYEKKQFKNNLKVDVNTKLTRIDEKGYHFEEIER